jgi:glycosyltransferase involved in cell wall biosynthesis
MKNIVIFSPNKNAYSETFIQAHKNYLKGNIHFLYGSWTPLYSEKNGKLVDYFYKNNPLSRFAGVLPSFLFIRFFSKTNQEHLESYLKKERIDIIIAEYGLSGSKNLEVIKKLNIPLIVHFHGFDASVNEVIKENKEIYKKMFEYAKSVVVVSNVMKHKLLKLGCPKEKIILNICGPNNLFIETIPKFTKKQFIAIGRFVDKKAPYYTIFSFDKVLQKHPDAKLIIAGDGQLLNTCRNIAKALKIENNIFFPGKITPEHVKNYLIESLAFVQHSVTAENGDMEGTPVAILEASAAGLPVISTKHAGIPDVIVHEETGLLVEEHDVEGMAENMLKVLNDIEYAKKLGTAGKQRIKDHFTMEKHISVIQNLIENV